MESVADGAVDPESVLDLPPAMRRLVVARRGDAAAAPKVDRRAVETYQDMVAELGEGVAAALARGAADLGLAADASSADLAAATPTSAAVTLAHFRARQRLKQGERSATVIDAWVGARGVVFAAEALVESMRIVVRNLNDNLPVVTKDFPGTQLEALFRLAARMREHLGAASDSDYAAADAAVAALRGDYWLCNGTASFLFPERRDWVGSDMLSFPHQCTFGDLARELLACSLSTAKHAKTYSDEFTWWAVYDRPRILANALASLGAKALPMLDGWLESWTDADDQRKLYGLIARVPSDEAFQRLLDVIDTRPGPQAVFEAAQRFPRRALRLLADAAGSGDDAKKRAVAHALRVHVLGHRDLAEELLPTLSPAAKTRVEALLAETAAVPTAEPETLPPLLTAPPWVTGQKPVKPVVIKDLTAPVVNEIAWREGEREEFANDRLPHWADPGRVKDWEAFARRAVARTGQHWGETACLVLRGPEEIVRPILPALHAGWSAEYWVRGAVARFEADALPLVLDAAKQAPAAHADYLMPFASSGAATFMADAFTRLKTARQIAQTWLKRHPEVAARTLIPAALGKAGPARRAAEASLRMLAASGFGDVIASASADYGAKAAAAVADLITDDGTLTLPKTMPELPGWAVPAVLPQILLKGRQAALPAEAAGFVVQMLTVSKASEPYAGLQVLRETCDAASLASFVTALFENWRAAGYPAKESFAFDALRWFGDDDTVRRLSPLIRAWPGEAAHQRAVTGLDVLAEIGGDTALIHLYGISQKVKFKGLKEQAAARIQAIADELGLTPEQLGDRLVPDSGLDADGSMTLDYGPRRFVVGFDEQLKPYVADEAGKRLKTLPKPGVKDDAELAAAAYARFSGLKKDVRTLASDQIKRLELAMCVRRRWTAQEFADYFVAHPLLRHIVRRLVWATFTADGAADTAFRVAEDLTFADVEDETFELPGDATVGIAHPLDLGDEVGTWSEMFADYEILQPFRQLGRPVFTLTDEERAATTLNRFAGITMPPLKVLGMERYGWRRSEAADAGGQGYMLRDLPDGRVAVVDLDPGLWIGMVSESPDQSFSSVWISGGEGGRYGYWSGPKNGGIPFSQLDPVTASEILRDLTEVTSP